MNADRVAESDTNIQNKSFLSYCKSDEFLDFVYGFMLGVFGSILSFYFLKFFATKKNKRKGMYYGCLFSFILIIFFCLSFTLYTFYVQKTLIVNRKLMKTNQKVIKVDNFSHFITTRVLRLAPAKVIYENPKKMKEPQKKASQRRYVTKVVEVKRKRKKMV